MRRHIVRALVALAAGGTALLTAGLTATTTAAQTGGTHAAAYPTTGPGFAAWPTGPGTKAATWYGIASS